MTKFSSFCLTMLLVIFFLGIKAAIVVAVSTFVVLYILDYAKQYNDAMKLLKFRTSGFSFIGKP